MASPCLKCREIVEIERGGDGHFYKRCSSCGYVGGPYTSSSVGSDDNSAGQTSIGDFSG